MSWNYRVMKSNADNGEGDTDWYSIREVYYNDKGEVDGWTEDEIAPCGESVDELRAVLQRMIACLDKPVLEDV